MIICIPHSIRFVERPDVQTVNYTKVVKDWLKQWTVANNFHPILIEACNEVQLREAQRAWFNAFAQSHLSALGREAVGDDFEFTMHIYVAPMLQMSKYKTSKTFRGNEI